MNKFILMGYVGQDPEERCSPNGVKMIIFSVPMNKFKNGEKYTAWVRCVSFGDNPFLEKHVKKGSHVCVTGTLDIPRVRLGKDGKQSVDMNMTCHHIEFASTGKKPEEKEGESWDPKVNKIMEERGPLTPAEPADDLPF